MSSSDSPSRAVAASAVRYPARSAATRSRRRIWTSSSTIRTLAAIDMPSLLGMDGRLVERAVEREDIDPRFAEEAEQRLFDPSAHQRAHRLGGKAARLGDAVNLIQSRLGADMGGEPRGEGGHQIGGVRESRAGFF